jgi:ribosome biogenesis GTPase / thiamine phosphate phosphatase
VPSRIQEHPELPSFFLARLGHHAQGATAVTDMARLGFDAERAADLAALERPDLEPARVVAVHRAGVDLLAAGGPLRGRVPGRLRHAAAAAADLPAVGDWVAVDPAGGEIAAVLPRRGGIARRAPNGRPVAQVLAANVDVALVVSSLNRELNLPRLERHLALAADAGAEAVVVLSKADLDDEPDTRAAEVAAALGGHVPVVALSVVTGAGLEALAGWLRPGVTAVLLGSSGVGKTTLRNALADGPSAATAPVRERDDRGRHTTTARELVPLSCGAVLIDTPGLRLPRLWQQAGGLAAAYADVETLARSCRFADCRHAGEPGCAVSAAVADGRLDPRRLVQHDKLAREQAWLEQRLDGGSMRERKQRAKRMQKEYRRTQRAKGRA